MRRQLLALPLLSVESMNDAFKVISDQYDQVPTLEAWHEVPADLKESIKDLHASFKKVLQYYRDTWIIDWKMAEFCCYHKKERTNNEVEARNRVVQTKIPTNPGTKDFICELSYI